MNVTVARTGEGAVLVVHADSAFAERVVRALRGYGLEAEPVADGERAIDRFVQHPARALVVGAELPGRDGEATIESIRWAPGGALVPIVLAAEHGSPAKLSDTGRRLGAATVHGADARDADLVAHLVRRTLGLPPLEMAMTSAAPDGHTKPAIAATHTSPTLSALGGLDGSVAGDDDDTLAPRASAVTSRGGRARETVATDTRTPAFADRAKRRPATDAPPDDDAPFQRGDDPEAEREGREVERRAADLTPGAAAHAGRFAELPFPRVLARLAAQRATGALVVVAPDDDDLRTTTGESPKKVVYFRNGMPVYVRSNLVRECLGQLLVANDVITPHARNVSVQRMRAGEGRQGAILLAMGALEPEQLRDALAEQLRTKLFDLFRWDTGEFRFTTRVPPPPEVVTLELGLAEIVFEGVVRRMTPARLLALLEPKLDAYVIPSTDRMTRFLRLDLVAEARHVLRVLDGTQRLRALLTFAGQRPGAAAQLVYAMECLGAVRFSDLPVPIDGHGTTDDGAVDRVPTDDAPGGDTGLPASRADATSRGPIPAFRARAPGASETARLVTPEARAHAPRAAVESENTRRPSDGAGPVPADGGVDWDDETNEVSSVAVLAGWLGYAPQDARSPGVVSVPRAPAAPEPRASDDDYDDATEADVEAFSIDTPPSRSAGGATAQAAPAATTPTPGANPGPSAAPHAAPAAALDARVERIAEAERHSRRGERALARSRLEDAEDAFARAAELVPDDAEFAARLAHTRLLIRPDDVVALDAALEALGRAAHLAPQRALPHLLLADVHQRRGDVPAARRALEDALTADPGCREALAQLGALAPPR